MLNIIKLWDSIENLASRISLVSYTINFIISYIFAYLFISFLSHDDFEKYAIFIAQLEKRSKKIYNKYVRYYALTTGLLAAIFIQHQFKGVRTFTATVYGLLGPYILKERMIKTLSNDSIKSINKTVDETISTVDKQIQEEYNNILKDTIEEGIKGDI